MDNYFFEEFREEEKRLNMLTFDMREWCEWARKIKEAEQ